MEVRTGDSAAFQSKLGWGLACARPGVSPTPSAATDQHHGQTVWTNTLKPKHSWQPEYVKSAKDVWIREPWNSTRAAPQDMGGRTANLGSTSSEECHGGIYKAGTLQIKVSGQGQLTVKSKGTTCPDSGSFRRGRKFLENFWVEATCWTGTITRFQIISVAKIFSLWWCGGCDSSGACEL